MRELPAPDAREAPETGRWYASPEADDGSGGMTAQRNLIFSAETCPENRTG